MKLSAHQIKQVCAQHPIRPLPDDLPTSAQLKKAFGDHTFFLLLDGLYVWEPTDASGKDIEVLNAVRVAIYTDEDRNLIVPQPPERSQVFATITPGRR